MNALTSEELADAAWAFHDRAREEQRTLDMIDRCCTAETRASIEARIAKFNERHNRFMQAAVDAYVDAVRHG